MVDLALQDAARTTGDTTTNATRVGSVPTWRTISRQIIQHPAADLVSVLATLLALFGRDFVVAFLEPAWDEPITAILKGCLTVFILEIVLTVGSNRLCENTSNPSTACDI